MVTTSTNSTGRDAGFFFGPHFTPRLTAFVFLVLVYCSNSVTYAADYQISDMEFEAWPPRCQARPDYVKYRPPPGRKIPSLSPREMARVQKVGLWHYCAGLVLLRRAELAPASDQRIAVAKQALLEVNYSYSIIDYGDPWFAEMSVSVARVYRVLEKPEKAREYLDLARKVNPRYAPIYTAYSLLFFDEGNYEEAAKILQEGNSATKGKVGELHYYLGLANFNLGNINAARSQAQMARSLGYPLSGLARKIAKHDRKTANAN